MGNINRADPTRKGRNECVNALTLDRFAKLTAKHIFFYDVDRSAIAIRRTDGQRYFRESCSAISSPGLFGRYLCECIHLTEFIYISPQNAISRCGSIENNEKRKKKKKKGERERSDRKIYQREIELSTRKLYLFEHNSRDIRT
jgi:hypothetical protein